MFTASSMSELGLSRRFGHAMLTSELPSSTDINTPTRLVRFVPKGDTARGASCGAIITLE